jgi:sulfur carrier protein
MTQSVTLVLRDKTFEVKPGIRLHEALRKMGINPEAVLATRQSIMITDDEILLEGETIQLISAISGG